MENYIELAQRTSAPLTPELIARLHRPALMGLLAFVSGNFIQNAQILEMIKKHVFYGRELKGFPNGGRLLMNEENHTAICQLLSSEKLIKLVHGVLGKASESGELMEQIMAHIFQDQPLDEVNIIEELGDDFWYSAEMCAALQETFERIQELNIKKLAARYGDKFSDQAALNRNLVNERKELESDKQLSTYRRAIDAWYSANPGSVEEDAAWEEVNRARLNYYGNVQ